MRNTNVNNMHLAQARGAASGPPLLGIFSRHRHPLQGFRAFMKMIRDACRNRIAVKSVTRLEMEISSCQKETTSIKYARLVSVKKHFSAISRAHSLRFGHPLTKRTASASRLKRLVKFITALLREGPKILSAFSHEARSHSLLLNTNTSSARKEFLASTVGRSVWWKVSNELLNTSVQKVRSIWQTKASLNRKEQHFRRLKEYITNVLPVTKLTDAELSRWPLPNDHAVLEKSRRQGGNAAHLMEMANQDRIIDFDEIHALLDPDPTLSQVVKGEVGVMDVLPPHIFQHLTGEPEVLVPVGEDIRLRYTGSRDPTPLRPMPLVEKGGKVRVVTLHPADEIHCARRLTNLWLSRLEKFAVTRQMLKNIPVELEPESRRGQKAQIYSADLSSATDYFDHELATHVGITLCEALGQDDLDVETVKRLFGPHFVRPLLPEGKEGDGMWPKLSGDNLEIPTTRGIHMGLGPTWVILSLVNSYAAWYAGAGRKTYSVCGDDLVGYWSRSVANKYEACLEDLGLVVNKSKSFFGRRGVFCERIVELVDDGRVAHAKDVGHLSAITAAKLVAGQSSNRFSVAAALKDNTIQRDLSNQVRQHLIPRGTGPGRVEHGGNGFGTLTTGGLALLIQEGKPNLSITEDISAAAVIKKLKHEATPGHERITDPILLSDAIVYAKAASQQVRYLKTLPTVTRPIDDKTWTKRNQRRKRMDSMSLSQVADLAQKSALSAKDKKIVNHIMSKHCRLKSKCKMRRLSAILSRPPAERLIARSRLIELLKEDLQIDWSKYVREREVTTHHATPPPEGGNASHAHNAVAIAGEESSSSGPLSGWHTSPGMLDSETSSDEKPEETYDAEKMSRLFVLPKPTSDHSERKAL